MKQRLVLVVCNGNIGRSVIAQACLNDRFKEGGLEKELRAISRGINIPPPHIRSMRDRPMEWSLTKPALEKRGISNWLSADCCFSANYPFVRSQGFNTHRPSGMESLGTDSYLCTYAKLAPIGEPGGDIVINYCGIDCPQKLLDMLVILRNNRNNRLGMM